MPWRLEMKTLFTALTITTTLLAAPLAAQDITEHKATVALLISTQGYACASVEEVAATDTANIYLVSCKDNGGTLVRYQFTIDGQELTFQPLQ